jgi:hypothetical protein
VVKRKIPSRCRDSNRGNQLCKSGTRKSKGHVKVVRDDNYGSCNNFKIRNWKKRSPPYKHGSCWTHAVSQGGVDRDEPTVVTIVGKLRIYIYGK